MASAGADGGPSNGERQIAIRLTTKDKRYSIPETKYFVPLDWRRFHLSELINKVLENEQAVPFDFLINQTLLRSTLANFCEQNNVSQETVLELEYLPSTLPPQLDKSIPSQDWVSDIQLGPRSAEILSASYSGSLSLSSNLFPSSPASFDGHDQAVLSCCFVANPLAEPSSSSRWVASGGMDRTVRIWEFEEPDVTAEIVTPTPRTVYTLPLHSGPVSSVRARKDSGKVAPHLLTAAWDGLIGVWDVTPGVNDGEAFDLDNGERRKKRRKQAPGVAVSKTPMGVLKGHVGKVSRAIFDNVNGQHIAHSAGFDHTVRSWDLNVGAERSSKTASEKVILDLAQLHSQEVLVSGSFDRTVSFWDLREDAQQTVSLTLTGHSGPVSSIAPHPSAQLMLASASYDSTVRIWDARSPNQALFVIPLPSSENSATGKEKILALDWDGERLVAGGEGNRIVSWRVMAGQEMVRT